MGIYKRVGSDIALAGPQIGVAVVLFIVASAVGALSPQIGEAVFGAFREFAEGLMDKGSLELTLAIFVRNSTTAFVGILGGVLFGLLPMMSILFNGILFGAVMRLVPGEFWRVLPHGVFELPAIFIAWGLGLWIGQWILDKPRLQNLKIRLGRSLRVFFVLIVPLLAVAAVIEGAAIHMYR